MKTSENSFSLKYFQCQRQVDIYVGKWLLQVLRLQGKSSDAEHLIRDSLRILEVQFLDVGDAKVII